MVETYDNATATSAAQLDDWAASHAADRIEAASGTVTGQIGERTLKHHTGEIWLEDGESYTFRETVDDFAQFRINDTVILSDNTWQGSSTGTFTAAHTGWHDWSFFAQNNGGPGHGKLEIKAGAMEEFAVLDGDTGMAAMLDAGRMKTEVTLIGDALGEVLIGSQQSDSIFGARGHDTIEGGGVSDVLSGGIGMDTFVFANGHGHDVIVEASATDSADN